MHYQIQRLGGETRNIQIVNQFNFDSFVQIVNMEEQYLNFLSLCKCREK